MALGGNGIGWDETNPADGRNIGLGAQDIRSLTTAISTGMDSEHVWPTATGKAGQHRAGSARVFYGTQSAVSSCGGIAIGADGRLMQTSDTSRLFGVGSTATVLLGAGPTSLSLGTFPGGSLPQRHYWVEEIGVDANTGSATITFPNSGFSGLPLVFCSSWSDGAGSGIPLVVNALSATAFTVVGSRCTVMWRSLGTRVL